MTKKNLLLKDAANPVLSTNLPGVYILRIQGTIMKVGSAKIGIQKRMQQYYDLNPACGLNRHINASNRSIIFVDYQTCLLSECAELESKLFDKYGPIEMMPWAERRPRSVLDTVSLLI